MIVDLHVHTARGGYDSSLTVPQVITEAEAKGIGVVCLTEHMHFWKREELDSYCADNNVSLIAASEVETELGHVLAFGLENYVSGIHRLKELRSIIDDVGGIIVAAHPFRMFFNQEDFSAQSGCVWAQVLEDALELPMLRYVDAIEVVNGGCTKQENLLAIEVAKTLHKGSTGGSDAHSEFGIGCFATIFEREIRNVMDLISELRAGRFSPAIRIQDGRIVPFADEGPPVWV